MRGKVPNMYKNVFFGEKIFEALIIPIHLDVTSHWNAPRFQSLRILSLRDV